MDRDKATSAAACLITNSKCSRAWLVDSSTSSTGDRALASSRAYFKLALELAWIGSHALSENLGPMVAAKSSVPGAAGGVGRSKRWRDAGVFPVRSAGSAGCGGGIAGHPAFLSFGVAKTWCFRSSSSRSGKAWQSLRRRASLRRAVAMHGPYPAWNHAVDGPPAQWAHGGLPRWQFLDNGVACQHRGEVGQRAASRRGTSAGRSDRGVLMVV